MRHSGRRQLFGRRRHVQAPPGVCFQPGGSLISKGPLTAASAKSARSVLIHVASKPCIEIYRYFCRYLFSSRPKSPISMRIFDIPAIPVEAPKTPITASHPESETRTLQGVAGFSLPQAVAILRALQPFSGLGRCVFPSIRAGERCISETPSTPQRRAARHGLRPGRVIHGQLHPGFDQPVVSANPMAAKSATALVRRDYFLLRLDADGAEVGEGAIPPSTPSRPPPPRPWPRTVCAL